MFYRCEYLCVREGTTTKFTFMWTVALGCCENLCVRKGTTTGGQLYNKHLRTRCEYLCIREGTTTLNQKYHKYQLKSCEYLCVREGTTTFLNFKPHFLRPKVVKTFASERRQQPTLVSETAKRPSCEYLCIRKGTTTFIPIHSNEGNGVLWIPLHQKGDNNKKDMQFLSHQHTVVNTFASERGQ